CLAAILWRTCGSIAHSADTILEGLTGIRWPMSASAKQNLWRFARWRWFFRCARSERSAENVLRSGGFKRVAWLLVDYAEWQCARQFFSAGYPCRKRPFPPTVSFL